ncbi:MAG: hypothetical protein HC808_01665 [Candidatus Competibacteraceae bacterium]|nr:hypothetical protein [Candidatus Competibacteraceae bacterium]
MAIQHDPGLHVYVSKSDIPSYQRDWVWGTAVLFVFICGLLTTWLLTPYFGSSRHLFGQVGQGEIGAEEVLARQEQTISICKLNSPVWRRCCLRKMFVVPIRLLRFNECWMP